MLSGKFFVTACAACIAVFGSVVVASGCGGRAQLDLGGDDGGSTPDGESADVLGGDSSFVDTGSDGSFTDVTIDVNIDAGDGSTCFTGTFCAGECTNENTDPKNCGGCGNVCPSGTVCSLGTCE